jgi:hypothetical protein
VRCDSASPTRADHSLPQPPRRFQPMISLALAWSARLRRVICSGFVGVRSSAMVADSALIRQNVGDFARFFCFGERAYRRLDFSGEIHSKFLFARPGFLRLYFEKRLA